MSSVLFPLMAAIRAEWPNLAHQSHECIGSGVAAHTKTANALLEGIFQAAYSPTNPPGTLYAALNQREDRPNCFDLVSGFGWERALPEGSACTACTGDGLFAAMGAAGANCLHPSRLFSSISIYSVGFSAGSSAQTASPLLFGNWLARDGAASAKPPSVPSANAEPESVEHERETAAGCMPGLFRGGQLRYGLACGSGDRERRSQVYQAQPKPQQKPPTRSPGLPVSGAEFGGGETTPNVLSKRELRECYTERGTVFRRGSRAASLSGHTVEQALSRVASSLSGPSSVSARSPVSRAGASPP